MNSEVKKTLLYVWRLFTKKWVLLLLPIYPSFSIPFIQGDPRDPQSSLSERCLTQGVSSEGTEDSLLPVQNYGTVYGTVLLHTLDLLPCFQWCWKLGDLSVSLVCLLFYLTFILVVSLFSFYILAFSPPSLVRLLLVLILYHLIICCAPSFGCVDFNCWVLKGIKVCLLLARVVKSADCNLMLFCILNQG